MNRRGFLGLLAKSAAAVVAGSVLPEILVAENKIEPVRTWFIPEHPRVGNQFITAEEIAKQAHEVLKNNLGLSMRLIREYDSPSHRFINRMDVLVGYAVLQPQHPVLIYSEPQDPDNWDVVDSHIEVIS